MKDGAARTAKKAIRWGKNSRSIRVLKEFDSRLGEAHIQYYHLAACLLKFMFKYEIRSIEDEEDYIDISVMTDAKVEVIDAYRVKELNVQVLKFHLPLDHSEPETSPKISVVAKLVTKISQGKSPSSGANWKLDLPDTSRNICVYLQGGPGFPCPAPPEYNYITNLILDKGFQMLYLDQRGTGLSTQIDSAKLLEFSTEEETLNYLKFFRALDIVNDAEAIRKSLIGDEKWTILGQSYGGFCSLTYLSYYPESLNASLITGGIPPINMGPDDVYTATYKRTEERNEAYYAKHPNDIIKVHEICEYLASNKVELPDGGVLSVERFQASGIAFGATAGTDSIHQLVFKLHYDLKSYGRFLFGTLVAAQGALSFDTNIIYFLFQEAIYLDTGMKSEWSADRLRYKSKINYDYASLSKKLSFNEADKTSYENAVYFTGEMVYKSMLDDFVELKPLKSIALKLHETTEWGKNALYKPEVLKQNSVPVAAATYLNDQYVSFDLQMKAKQYIKGIKQFVTSEFFHNGVKDDPARVLETLLKLLENGEVM